MICRQPNDHGGDENKCKIQHRGDAFWVGVKQRVPVIDRADGVDKSVVSGASHHAFGGFTDRRRRKRPHEDVHGKPHKAVPVVVGGGHEPEGAVPNRPNGGGDGRSHREREPRLQSRLQKAPPACLLGDAHKGDHDEKSERHEVPRSIQPHAAGQRKDQRRRRKPTGDRHRRHRARCVENPANIFLDRNLFLPPQNQKQADTRRGRGKQHANHGIEEVSRRQRAARGVGDRVRLQIE